MGDAGVAGAGAGVSRPNHHHNPMPSDSTITSIAHSGLRPRRTGVNGVPRSGACPRRRLASDFFKASRISDMGKIKFGKGRWETCLKIVASDGRSHAAGAQGPEFTVGKRGFRAPPAREMPSAADF